jgi:hypothetical protein
MITPAAGAAQVMLAVGEHAFVDQMDPFRAINDGIRKLGQTWRGTYDFVCECADPHCAEAMQMSDREHDLLRAVGDRFAVVPGHENESEVVLARTDRYVLIQRPRHSAVGCRAGGPHMATQVRSRS